jgi:peptidoglycan/xylan/chitin deacetylase (PgdA/CDA1 family)
MLQEISLFQRSLIHVSGGFVLALHEIAPERLEELLEALRPARPVELSELVERSKEGLPTSGLFAITVDDGVGDNVRALVRFFRGRSCPATFYLPTRYIETGEGMAFQWWRQSVPRLPQRKLSLGSGTLDFTRPDTRDAFAREMQRRWHSERLETYLPVIMELASIAARESGIDLDAMRPPAPITWAEVEELSADDLIRFESHGVSHSAMSALSDEEIESEMRVSQALVSEYTGHSCRHYAYPFGSTRSIGDRAPVIASRFYDSAVTMSLGSVDAANSWLLPRIPLYPENSPLVARMKVLLKCFHLSRAFNTDGGEPAPA